MMGGFIHREQSMVQLTLLDTLMGILPIFIAVVIYGSVLNKRREIIVAGARMVFQLIVIGYCLSFIFEFTIPWIGILVMAVMISAATVISIRPLFQPKKAHYLASCSALILAGGFNLCWILYAVLKLDPIYQPQVIIPLAGMVFANGMNAISIAAERFESEQKNDGSIKFAFNAAMIPQVNALLAVGLVSLPGMMTGQILSGTSPIIAVRYQIIIMSMVISNSAMVIWLYFFFLKKQKLI